MLYQKNKKIGLSLTCYRRPDYLEIVLDSLKNSITYCSIDTSNTTLYVSIDHYDDLIPNIITNIDWINVKYIINNPSIGCNANTRQAILMSMKDNDATIHFEDDTVLCKDAMNFYLHNLDEYHNDDSIINVCGYNKTNSLDNIDLKKIIKEKRFISWGCSFWKHKFDILLNNWTKNCRRENGYTSWDSHLDKIIFQNEDYDFYQIKPQISRIQNIGAVDGTWVDSVEFHEKHQFSPYTSNDLL